MQRSSAYKILASAKAINGVGEAMLVEDFRNIELEITNVGAGSITLKVQGSQRGIITDTIDFSAASTPANPWIYVQSINLSTGNPIDGATGISLTGSVTYLLEVNTNGMAQVNIELSGVSGTVSVTVRAKAYSNQ